MLMLRSVIVSIAAFAAVAIVSPAAHAVSPRNPYRSFNLSGVNYGSMQWERAQQQGKRVWPYYNTPSRTSSRTGTVVAGGLSGTGSAVTTQGRSSSRSRGGLFRRR